MNFLIYIAFLITITFLLNNILLKKNLLLNETGDNHQKFASKNKVPLTGGIFLFLSILFFINLENLNFFIFSFLILFLGIFSDLKYILSAKKRLFFQISIVIVFIFLEKITIQNTRVYFLDDILATNFVNYLFVGFCVLIVINGSNFFDGLNTLNIGYFFFITSIIFYLDYNNEISLLYFSAHFLLISLGILYLFNFFNKIFMGDSGSLLFGFIFSVLMIKIYELNQFLSPFFIILLLWYPSYETLFSIIRKYTLKKSPMKPDSKHLHQLIFYFVKKKFLYKTIYANIFTANLINMYNLIIFIIALNFKTNTQIQIILILLNLFIYTVIYLKMFAFRYKKK